MKAIVQENGTVVLRPESGADTFVLRRMAERGVWVSGVTKRSGSGWMIAPSELTDASSHLVQIEIAAKVAPANVHMIVFDEASHPVTSEMRDALLNLLEGWVTELFPVSGEGGR